jgi:hypothetical protein
MAKFIIYYFLFSALAVIGWLMYAAYRDLMSCRSDPARRGDPRMTEGRVWSTALKLAPGANLVYLLIGFTYFAGYVVGCVNGFINGVKNRRR